MSLLKAYGLFAVTTMLLRSGVAVVDAAVRSFPEGRLAGFATDDGVF
jgi:hypothetical protein